MTEGVVQDFPEATQESPLVVLAQSVRRDLSVDARACALDELPFLDMVNLRGAAADPRFADAVRSATGLELPLRPNSASRDGAVKLIWLGPDEWLLKLAPGQGESMAAVLRAALVGQHASVVEVGSGYTTFTVQGPAAGDLLARGCPLDLYPSVFAAAAVAQSHIARAPVLIDCLEAGLSFELTVRRSFAPYLHGWLVEAGWS